MLQLKIDSRQVSKMLENTVSYSYGFLEGTEINQIVFNEKLGLFIEDALKKYIDSKARMNPKSLHHVYEWGKVGSPSARLFDFKVSVSKRMLTITGSFLKSKSIPPGGDEPFTDKANIMENQIAVFVSPKNASVLVFEDNGDTIFTPNTVYIEHPGGSEVAESFAVAFDEFFNIILTGSLIHSSGIFSKLSTPKEFAEWFPEGTKNGKGAGVKAGQKYMDMPEGLMIQ
jgi:hypothetical protein